jgi:ketosteroid isomerase-like protein
MSAGSLDEAAIMSEQFFAALVRGDVSAMENMHTDNSVVLPPNERIIQRETIKAFWRSLAPRLHNQLQFTVVSVELLGGGAAREIGRFRYMPKREDAEPVLFKYLILWQKVGGEWKIAALAWNRPETDQQRLGQVNSLFRRQKAQLRRSDPDDVPLQTPGRIAALCEVPPRRKCVFVHVPKAAGTGLNIAMRYALGPDAVSQGFNASNMTSSEAERLDQFDVISGHISMADVSRYFPDRAILTILRDPIDRCLSWYYWARQDSTPSFSSDIAAAKRHDIESFFDLDHRFHYRNVFNRQVRQLGDHVLNVSTDLDKAYDAAKDTLRSAVWVGRQETLAADLEKLGMRLPEMAGLPMSIANATGQRTLAADASPRVIKRIRELNAYDLDLYAFASAEIWGDPFVKGTTDKYAVQSI